MAKKIPNIIDFLKDIKKMLQVVVDCSPILFEKEYRGNVKTAGSQVIKRLNEKIRRLEGSISTHNKYDDQLDNAGLTGAQGKLKLNLYSYISAKFNEKGNIWDLENALEVGNIVLKSIAGAIPAIGSFAQELIDVILYIRKKSIEPNKSDF